jgi:hypothetical protein
MISPHRALASGQSASLAPAQPAEPAPHSGDSGVEIMYWMSIATTDAKRISVPEVQDK